MINLLIETIKIAFAAITGNKIRSFLTTLGVVIGVFAVITIVAIGTGLKDNIRSQIVSLGADTIDVVPGSMDQEGQFSLSVESMLGSLDQENAEAIRKEADLIKYVSETYQFSGRFRYGKKTRTSFVVGVHPDYFKIREKKADAGELFNTNHLRKSDKVVVIGHNVGEKLFGSLERAVGKEMKINGKAFKVIGVLETEDFKFGQFDIDDAVYIPSNTAKATFDDARITDIFMKVVSEDKVEEAEKQIEKILKRGRGEEDFTIMSQESMLEMVDRIMGMVTSALAGLAAISLLVGGIGIMNIMLVSVTERTKEIGIRKALGATDRDILMQFLVEAVVLCVFGGGIGVGVAGGASFLLTKYANLPTLINIPTVFAAFIFSIFVGVIFGTAPALKAARKDPIDALRYE